jgi:hypothetical protein
MRRKTLNISSGFVISILMMLSTTQQALAQCNWSTKVRLAQNNIVAPPGLASSGDRLILTWGGGSDLNGGVFTSMISFNGVNWSNQVTRPDFPRIAVVGNPYNGLGMTYSPPCNGVYAAWRDNNNNMWATKSADGINWDAAHFIVGSALSGPALRGDNGSLPIGFAFSTNSSTYPGKFESFKGKFNCDFSNPVFPIQGCFFNDGCLYYHGQSALYTPAWAGAGGMTELSAITTGSPNIGIAQILYEVNNDFTQSLPDGFWSNNGLAGTVNPSDGTPYIAWTCHPDSGDTCSGSGTGTINILNVITRAHMVCTGDASARNPAMTFFQGKIWVAWQRGTITSDLTVASLNPF